jgi:hypothetical protein
MANNKIPLALGFNPTTNVNTGLEEFIFNLSDVGDFCDADIVPSPGDVLTYDSSNNCWKASATPAVAAGALSALTDICAGVTSVTQYQALVWNGTEWCPSTIPTGGGGGGYTPPLSPSIGDLIVDDATGDFQGKIGSATFFTQGIADNDILSLAFDAGEEQILKWNGTSLESGRLDQLVIEVRANTGVTISKGDAVYVTGFHSNNRVYVERAQANSPATMPAIGLASTDISEDTNGLVVSFGKTLVGDNSSFVGNIGDTVYVSETTPGALTTTHPAGPDDLIQNIGFLAKKDSTNGIIKVTGVGRANDIPNTITLGDTTLTPTDAKLDGTTASELVITDANNKIASVASSTLFNQGIIDNNIATTPIADGDLESTFLKDQTATIDPVNLNLSPGANKIVAVDNAGTAFEAGVISDLDDVTFSPDPTQGQSLVYDGDGVGGWIASTIPTGGAGFVDGSSVSATFSAIQVDDLIVNRLGEGRPTNFIWASDFYLVGSTANGWGQGGQGTGAGLDGTAAYNGPTDRAIGVIRLKSGVGTNGRYNLTTFNQTMDPSTVGLSLSTRVLVSGLWDNGVNDGDVMFGISDNGNTQSMPSDGIYFRYGNSNSNWVAGVANGGSVTETDTTIAPTPGTFQVLQIMCDENWTTAQFFIDGVKRATLTLGVDNFPTGTNRMGFRYAVINDTTNVTTGNQLIIDWHYFKITCSQSRGENYIRAKMDPIE